MKLKLLVFTLALFPAFAFGQTTRTNCLYNKGKMTVKGTGTNQTLMYVGGDFVAGTDAADNNITSEVIIDNAKVRITGDLVNNVNNKTVFVKPGASYGSYTPGVFEFRPLSTSPVAQRIYSDSISNVVLANRKSSYIDFPGLQIANSMHVTADPAIAMKTGDITLEEGWLILDSRRTKNDDIDPSITDQDIKDVLLQKKTVTAHLQVTGNATYQNWGNADYNKAGMVQVNMALDEFNNAFEFKSLVGLGIPFQGLYPDYFMWNYVFVPGSTGKIYGDLRDPRVALEAGRGYLLGVDLRGPEGQYYTDHRYDQFPTNNFASRGTSDFYFNRFKFATDAARNSNQVFGNYTSANQPYQVEKLNTQDVQVRVVQGYNYLSNPFTAPLDVSDLLVSNSSVNTDWGMVIANDGTPALEAARNMVNRVWVLNGDANARFKTPSSAYYDYNLKYYLATENGSTYLDEDNGVTIAPQQMFVIYVTNPPAGNMITIPASKQVMSNALFLRSNKDTGAKQDDFVFEVIDAETGTSDRASIVLRTTEEIANDRDTNGKRYVNVPRVTTNRGEGEITPETKSLRSNDDGVEQTISSQLFTKDDETTDTFRALTAKYLPIEEGVNASTRLYMKPSSENQKIAIRGLRMNTVNRVRQVILEDTKYNRSQDLTGGELYITTSEPNDRSDRFIVHFYANPVGIDTPTDSESVLSVYYANGTVNVTGFVEADFGSTISLYDAQGRNMKNVKVNDYTMVMDINIPSGVYIVKVTGNKSFVKKILVNE